MFKFSKKDSLAKGEKAEVKSSLKGDLSSFKKTDADKPEASGVLKFSMAKEVKLPSESKLKNSMPCSFEKSPTADINQAKEIKETKETVKEETVREKIIRKGVKTDDSFSRYELFNKRKDSLVNILGKASDAMNELDALNLAKRLDEIKEKVQSESFKVQIVGTFKNGKSTFINSFLGEEVLPAYALPCTAVINEVKYGAKKKAILHFKNPIPKTLPEELSLEAMQHMKKYSMKNIPPMEIPYDKIEDYVVIPMGKEPKDMLLESPYEKVELYWPLEILKNGIEIIDSPGLNEHATRTKVTMDYLSKADAIIFVLNATTLCSMDEMTFIENNLKAQGFEDLFFVVNRYDLIPEKEKGRIVKYAQMRLKDFTSFGEKGIFFLSARDALDAKISSDKEKLENSGMIHFEKILSFFLTKYRGKLKLAAPVKELRRILKSEALGKIIPQKNKMLESSVDELKGNYDKIKPKIAALQERKAKMRDKIYLNIQKSYDMFKLMGERNIENVIEQVPKWVDVFSPVVKLGATPSKAKIKAFIDEVSVYISEKFEKNISLWQSTKLIPEMKRRSESIFANAITETQAIMKEAHHTSGEIAGKDVELNISDYTFEYDFGMLYKKDALGMKDLGFSREIAGRTLMVMLSMVSPTALFGVLAVWFFGAAKKKEATLQKLKVAVIREIQSSLQNTKDEFSRSVALGVTRFYNEMLEKIIAPIDNEIKEIQNQIETTISDIEKGQTEVNKKKDVIKKTESKIIILCEKSDKIIAVVGEVV